MKKLISTFATILVFNFIAVGQSGNNLSNDKPNLITYRSESKCYFPELIDMKLLEGYWITLEGNAMVKIYQKNNKFMFDGDYFPGISRNSDEASLSIVGAKGKYYFLLNYMFGANSGGSIPFMYYPNEDHIVIGIPPYQKMEDGQLTTTQSVYSSEGIYGKEFKRIGETPISGNSTSNSTEPPPPPPLKELNFTRENGIMTITVNKDGIVSLVINEMPKRKELLKKIGEEYLIPFSDDELEKFDQLSSFSVKINVLKQYLALKPSARSEILMGIPLDPEDNQLKAWVKLARYDNNLLGIIIQAKKNAPENAIENVIKSLNEIRIRNYRIENNSNQSNTTVSSNLNPYSVVSDALKVADIEETKVKTNNSTIVTENSSEDEKIYQVIETLPQFVGGDDALSKYIDQNLQYPLVAKVNNREGRVIVRFVVTKNGFVNKAEIVRSLSPECDKEALRLVKSFPQFIPGKQDGKNVSVWYTLPIMFKINNSL